MGHLWCAISCSPQSSYTLSLQRIFSQDIFIVHVGFQFISGRSLQSKFQPTNLPFVTFIHGFRSTSTIVAFACSEIHVHCWSWHSPLPSRSPLVDAATRDTAGAAHPMYSFWRRVLYSPTCVPLSPGPSYSAAHFVSTTVHRHHLGIFASVFFDGCCLTESTRRNPSSVVLRIRWSLPFLTCDTMLYTVSWNILPSKNFVTESASMLVRGFCRFLTWRRWEATWIPATGYLCAGPFPLTISVTFHFWTQSPSPARSSLLVHYSWSCPSCQEMF